MFSIGFTNEELEYPYDDTSIPAQPGCLILDGSTEDFLANLSLWSKADYESHWKLELGALLGGRRKVALVVSYDNPEASSNMEIWRVYRDGEWAHLQNQLLQYRQLPKNFSVSELSQYIQDRVVVTEEGNKISEWDVSVHDIEAFLSGDGPI
ncbi:hypothetical protein [Granulicella mallensis]|uniref:CdiI C-terminal domain-containing protein n=1 Tax=Granulicella mallensis TaxID=940614 RepID=A0A7W7ZSB5_9BACT|nr:hypothetical protein [Granulicella mallensis]MBB5065250.1 hypothetical protein [Granulicella mallensis]